MFTGLIQQLGTFESAAPRGSGIQVRIGVAPWDEPFVRGESIAVDGCCLTVEAFDDGGFTVFASPETMEKTSLGDRRGGDAVNLERAMRPTDRLGGHLVAGHVDATGRLRSVRELEDAWEVWVEAPEAIIDASVPKGSVAVDGISLTIVDLAEDALSLWIIPETWARTTLSRRAMGDRVNLESDMIGKYVYRYLDRARGAAEGSDESRLEELWQAFRAR